MPEMSEEEREALQAEHDELMAAQRVAESEQLAENEAANYKRTHAVIEQQDELDQEFEEEALDPEEEQEETEE